jgi:hypothetical protein
LVRRFCLLALILLISNTCIIYRQNFCFWLRISKKNKSCNYWRIYFQNMKKYIKVSHYQQNIILFLIDVIFKTLFKISICLGFTTAYSAFFIVSFIYRVFYKKKTFMFFCVANIKSDLCSLFSAYWLQFFIKVYLKHEKKGLKEKLENIQQKDFFVKTQIRQNDRIATLRY